MTFESKKSFVGTVLRSEQANWTRDDGKEVIQWELDIIMENEKARRFKITPDNAHAYNDAQAFTGGESVEVKCHARVWNDNEIKWVVDEIIKTG